MFAHGHYLRVLTARPRKGTTVQPATSWNLFDPDDKQIMEGVDFGCWANQVGQESVMAPVRPQPALGPIGEPGAANDEPPALVGRLGHLGLALAVCLNPVLLPVMWQGANDVLLVAGMAVAAVALAERRVVLAGLGLGAALAVKVLVAPMVVLFLVWVAAQVRRGRLEPSRAWRAAGGVLAPAAVTALPFLAWHPGDFLTDAVGYHLGLVADAYPIAGFGLPALLLRAGVVTDRYGPSPPWATLLPAAATLLAGSWWVWIHPGRRILLGVSGLVLLGVLFFHRSFMFYYVDVAVAALLLAAVAEPAAPFAGDRSGVPVRPPGPA